MTRSVGTGQRHPDPRPAAEHRQHPDRRHRREPRLSHARCPAAGTFGLFWNNTFLFNYDVTVADHDGTHDRSAGGHRAGQPRPGLPAVEIDRHRSTGRSAFGASLTGRYISRSRKRAQRQPAQAGFYTDAQLRWTPNFVPRRFGFAVGVNNLFNVRIAGLLQLRPQQYGPDDLRRARAAIITRGSGEGRCHPPGSACLCAAAGPAAAAGSRAGAATAATAAAAATGSSAGARQLTQGRPPAGPRSHPRESGEPRRRD